MIILKTVIWCRDNNFSRRVNMFFQIVLAVRIKMPKVRRSRKPPPEGWELIEPTLEVVKLKTVTSQCWCFVLGAGGENEGSRD